MLTPPRREAWWKLYLEKFDDPVIRILIIAGLLSFGAGFAHGAYYEGVGIVVTVLLATGLSFVNEHRAGAEFDLLNQSGDDVPVKVLRDGAYTTVPRRDVVVGDMVLLSQGDEVPADGRLLESVDLQVNESSLTGELVAAKNAVREEPGEGTYPAYRVYRGTTVVDGSGTLIVLRVGDATEIGCTARAAAEYSGEKSPLNQQLERLSRWIGVAGFTLAVATFAVLVARAALTGELILTSGQWAVTGALLAATAIALVPVWLPIVYDFLELTGHAHDAPRWLSAGWKTWSTLAATGLLFFFTVMGTLVLARVLEPVMASWLPLGALQSLLLFFTVAVTVVVVAVPEGLAMSVTLSLAYSMRRMTASNCLVRRLDATETIGAATHVCADKTGTLTMNQMRVQEAHLGMEEGVPLLVEAALAVNGTANLGADEGDGPRVIGNPTEGALLLWLAGQGQDYRRARGSFGLIRQWPFSADLKFMATLAIAPGEGMPVLHVKGAPDVVLALCTRRWTGRGTRPLSRQEREEIAAQVRRASGRAMRTLAFAFRAVAPGQADGSAETLARELVWIGWVGMADPVRPEVRDAVARARRAGIDVKIVTGDHPETAREVGRQIGLWSDEDDRTPGRLMLGCELAALTEAECLACAGPLKILARARPAEKLRLVRALQTQGGVVAVTGDGTNDAPALNHAAVGLSMGRSGTAVAREASDIVILDDSFGSITTAVQWGRSLYLNIQKFILFQLTINVAACGIVLLGPMVGVALPLKVTQMLWVNLIMDTFAALALATEPPEESVMRQPPRRRSDFIVSPAMSRRIFGVGLLFLTLCVGLLRTPAFGYPVGSPGHLTVFFTFFVLLQFWNAFNARTLGSSRSAFQGIGGNPWFLLILAAILVGQVLIVQLGGEVFHVTALPLRVWAVLVPGTSVVLWAGEAGRFLARRAAQR